MIGLLSRIFAVLGLVAVVAACSSGGGLPPQATKPLSREALTRLAAIGSSPEAPMLVRIFKEESVLEVWKLASNGSYQLFRSYEICAWSGVLGPKFREGDYQAPEGFYTITPALMHPHSNYHLAFNIGFPNKFDRAHQRSGSFLMVHGDCSSVGCYAMTDGGIEEIYALARDSFVGGNRSFQVQIFPFRMTTANLMRHRDSEHIGFWLNLKEGYDHFEIARRPPEWDVCELRYVFNVAADTPLAADGICPAGRTDPALAIQVADRAAADRMALGLGTTALAYAAAE